MLVSWRTICALAEPGAENHACSLPRADPSRFSERRQSRLPAGDAQNQARPTAQSQAATKELQKLERNEQADEIDCFNTLARARQILASPVPPTTDRYARDRHHQ